MADLTLSEWQEEFSSLRAQVNTDGGAAVIKRIYEIHKISNLLYQMPHWSGGTFKRASGSKRKRAFEDEWMEAAVTPHDELERFREFSRPWSKWNCLMMFVYLLYVIKNTVFLGLKLTTIDSYSSGHKMQTVFCADGLSPTKTIIRQLDCLRTNCTRLTSELEAGENLESHLKELSIYTICHPYLEEFFLPTIAVYPIGFIQLSWLTCWIMIATIIVPIYGALFPVESMPLMYLHCPISGAQWTRGRQIEHMIEYMSSFENYKNNIGRQLILREDFEKFLKIKRKMHSNLVNIKMPNRLQMSRGELEFERPSFRQALECLRQRGLCLPIEFTDWWRTNASKQYMVNAIQQFLICNIVPYGLFALSHYRPEHARRLERFAAQVRRDNCAFWRHSETDSCHLQSSPLVFDLSDTSHEWTRYTLMENFTSMIWPAFIGSALMADLFYGVVILKVKILELREQVMVSIEMINLMAALKHSGLVRPATMAPNSNFVPLNYLRKEFLKTVTLWQMLVFRGRHKRNHSLCNTALEERLAYQELAFNILRETDFRPESYLNLIESIQLNAWSLTESFKQLNGQSTRGLTLCYAIVYGFTIMSVLTNQRFPDAANACLLFTFVAVMATNVVILICSSVHSCAKTLRPVFWSLMALQTDADDLQLGHAKLLWLKQMIEIDHHGGLALRVFNRINVTYVGIIELTVWTSSILLLAYSRH